MGDGKRRKNGINKEKHANRMDEKNGKTYTNNKKINVHTINGNKFSIYVHQKKNTVNVDIILRLMNDTYGEIFGFPFKVFEILHEPKKKLHMLSIP